MFCGESSECIDKWMQRTAGWSLGSRVHEGEGKKIIDIRDHVRGTP